MIFDLNKLEEVTKEIAYKKLGSNADEDLSMKMKILNSYVQSQLRLFGVKSSFCEHKWSFSAPNRKRCTKCDLKVLC